jgi:transcriptional regulator with XRE-family HTH domain
MQPLTPMVIGERLRALRQRKKLSQGQIEERTGLMRCYISRIEHGHLVPSIETLEKMCRALEVPLFQFFYEGDGPPPAPKYRPVEAPSWGRSGREARLMAKFRRLLSRIHERDRQLLLHVAREMTDHKRH